MEELEAQWTKYSGAHVAIKGLLPPRDEMAELEREAEQLALRQKKFGERLQRRREALLLSELLACARDNVCLIQPEGDYKCAIYNDMPRGEDRDGWADRHGLVLRNVRVRLDGRGALHAGPDGAGLDGVRALLVEPRSLGVVEAQRPVAVAHVDGHAQVVGEDEV